MYSYKKSVYICVNVPLTFAEDSLLVHGVLQRSFENPGTKESFSKTNSIIILVVIRGGASPHRLGGGG